MSGDILVTYDRNLGALYVSLSREDALGGTRNDEGPSGEIVNRDHNLSGQVVGVEVLCVPGRRVVVELR